MCSYEEEELACLARHPYPQEAEYLTSLHAPDAKTAEETVARDHGTDRFGRKPDHGGKGGTDGYRRCGDRAGMDTERHRPRNSTAHFLFHDVGRRDVQSAPRQGPVVVVAIGASHFPHIPAHGRRRSDPHPPRTGPRRPLA